jgi:hypothetical protein
VSEEVVVLNYDRLGKIFETKPRKGTKKISKRDLARGGEASEKFDVVRFDESRALKKPERSEVQIFHQTLRKRENDPLAFAHGWA